MLPLAPDPMPQLTADQQADAALAARQGFLNNFSEAGYGKTYYAIHADYLWRSAKEEAGEEAPGCTLVLARGKALTQWAMEFEAYYAAEDLPISIYMVTSGDDCIPEGTDVVLMSHGMLPRMKPELNEQLTSEIVPQSVLIDEIHYYVNRDAQKSKLLNWILDSADALYGDIFVTSLTGTPVIRYNDNLFSILSIVCQHLLHKFSAPTYEVFRDKWTVWRKRQVNKWRSEIKAIANKNEPALNALLYEPHEDGTIVAVRRAASLAVQLTQYFTEVKIDPLTVDDRALMLDIQENKYAEAHAADTTDLQAACIAAAHAKLKGTCELVEELVKENGPVFLVAEHLDIIDLAEAQLIMRNLSVGLITGATKHVEETKEAFNKGEIDVLIGQLVAAGDSLNLQGTCRTIVVLETGWSYSQLAQVMRRVFRRGQKHDCAAHVVRAGQGSNDAILISAIDSLQWRVIARKKTGHMNTIEGR